MIDKNTQRILLIVIAAWLLLTVLSSIGPLVHTLLVLALIFLVFRFFFGSSSKRRTP